MTASGSLRKNQEYMRLDQIGRENAKKLNANLPMLPIKLREYDFKGLFKETRYQKYEN